ncbi:DUF4468 domain-containing protein [Acinetobacter baumannii]|uniref:DUF4468 domain-containing protein n=1 Tax=Acinetobacter calcoaceticus/baumannii complex TaxID=909768 RepID=UPI00056F7F9B|nr:MULTISPECIES: DUF4468 domain-containing protein [Acinetobacter calcoaceticus/baumannii complex]EHU1491220.1 DUF4468 domain-containing protein [Acinetobacter baumannii]KQE95455.1 hypothetical protein APB97_13490 [Acinetobacter baumannii]MBD0438537.1 DUF4468 domain-containing protein [Acinetobacter baumannii]MBO8210153.1 DUF4468 domain-containing protein [Acinetobacter nosocomialis]MBO8226683.1 DUF4468 domain-containing protein [Acinetobacter nosocomialis]
MKKIIVATVISLGLVGCMTPMTSTQQAMPEISQVIEVPNKTKDQIFEDSKIWIAQSFKSANNVIQYSDKSTGSIIGKGNIPYPCDGFIDCGAFGNDKVNFTIKIDTKENKARVTINDVTRTNLTYVQGAINNIGKDVPITIVQHQQKIAVKLNNVIEQYKTAITSKQTNENW